MQHGLRRRTIKANPAADVLLPEKRAGKTRKSLSIDQMQHLVVEAIPGDPRPAIWLTGLMCGFRPGELAGLRWPYVDIDADSPSIHVVERVLERPVSPLEVEALDVGTERLGDAQSVEGQ